MMIAKAGVAKLRVYDNNVVTPGVLVRQGFDRRQIAYAKSSATKVNVEAAVPCQSARNVDPLSASNIHPPVGDQRLACPALAGVAEGRPSAGDGYFGFSFENGS